MKMFDYSQNNCIIGNHNFVVRKNWFPLCSFPLVISLISNFIKKIFYKNDMITYDEPRNDEKPIMIKNDDEPINDEKPINNMMISDDKLINEWAKYGLLLALKHKN